jgi:hypothetical protein
MRVLVVLPALWTGTSRYRRGRAHVLDGAVAPEDLDGVVHHQARIGGADVLVDGDRGPEQRIILGMDTGLRQTVFQRGGVEGEGEPRCLERTHLGELLADGGNSISRWPKASRVRA